MIPLGTVLLLLGVGLATSGRLRTSRPLLLTTLGVLMLLGWMVFASPPARVWWAVDNCLDRGGRWNERLRHANINPGIILLDALMVI